MIINPGSENKGGTLKQAKLNAKEWLINIHTEGFLDVEMEFVEEYKDKDAGIFLFNFTHSVTQKVTTLETHGFTAKECESFIFYPRCYWNGCSVSVPKIENWLTDDFLFKITFYKK